MQSPVSSLSLVSVIVVGQTTNQRLKRGAPKTGTPASNPAPGKTLKICQGVPIPEGYIIVASQNSSSCPHGAYVLKKDDGAPVPQAPMTTASRPRKAGNTIGNSIALNPPEEINLLTLVEVLHSEAGALRSDQLRLLTVDVVGRHWQFPLAGKL